MPIKRMKRFPAQIGMLADRAHEIFHDVKNDVTLAQVLRVRHGKMVSSMTHYGEDRHTDKMLYIESYEARVSVAMSLYGVPK